MAWYLDTNIVGFCLRGKSPPVMQRLHADPATEVRLPLQVQAELLVGAAKSAHPTQAEARVRAFIAPFDIAWPDPSVADHYVSIRTHLELAGTPIDEADLWIAATARAAGGTLVTNNTRDFARVPSLAIEDWSLVTP